MTLGRVSITWARERAAEVTTLGAGSLQPPAVRPTAPAQRRLLQPSSDGPAPAAAQHGGDVTLATLLHVIRK